MRRCCSLHQRIKSHARSHCQKRKIHLGVSKLIAGSCPFKCGQILGMAEKRHIWLSRDQKAKYSQAQVMQCPFVAAIGITRLYETPDFLLRISSSSPSVAAVPAPLVTSSPLSLFTCKMFAAGCKRKQKREFALTSPLHCKVGRTCDQLLPSWDLEHFRQTTGPACSPPSVGTLSTSANLPANPPCGRSSLTKPTPPTTVIWDCPGNRVLLSAGQPS